MYSKDLYKILIYYFALLMLSIFSQVASTIFMYILPIFTLPKNQLRTYGISMGRWSKKNTYTLIALILIAFPAVYIARCTPHLHYALSWKLAVSQFLIAALPEELFFRSLIQTQLSVLIRNRILLFCTVSLMFTVAHIPRGVNTFSLLTFLPSVAFCYVKEEFKSILPAILLHTLYNLMFFTL